MENKLEEEKRRRDRFSELLKILIEEEEGNISAIAKKFGRERSYVQRWIDKQGIPFLSDYISLQKLLGFHSLDAFIAFIDSDYAVKDCKIHVEVSYSYSSEKLADHKRREAKRLEQEANYLIALVRKERKEKGEKYFSPLRYLEKKMDTIPLSYNECEKLRLLLEASADERNLPLEAIFERARIPPGSQMHITQPQLGTYNIESAQLERLLPYLYVVASWMPLELACPLRSYNSLPDLMNDLRTNGMAYSR